jgi:hypothetical protein
MRNQSASSHSDLQLYTGGTGFIFDEFIVGQSASHSVDVYLINIVCFCNA